MPRKKLLVSIIIPLPRFNDYIRESIKYYEILDAAGFEIIILPDEEEKEILSGTLPVRIIISGKVGPAEKRDLGAKNARGEILAFIDDDAYPRHDWFTNASVFFKNKEIGAVGGPAVTPGNEDFWKKISGNVFESYLGGGTYRKRYIPVGKVHEDYDLPSVNLMVRKSVFVAVGGFDSSFYPGEDTKLCLEIKKAGYKILYSPDVLVYHHRRNLFPNHFNQVANYALHRGFFVKKYPETSLRFSYFIQSLFLLFTVFGFLASAFSREIALFYWSAMGFYFLLNVVCALKPGVLETFWTVIGVFFTHLTYGFNFIKGLVFTAELKR